MRYFWNPDFDANEESLQFFREAFQLKQTKYSKMSVVPNNPLSYPIPEFVTYYWPGMIKCCSQLQSNRKELTQHLVAVHSNIGKHPLKLAIVPSMAVRAQQLADNNGASDSSSSLVNSPPPSSFKTLNRTNSSRKNKQPCRSPSPPPVAIDNRMRRSRPSTSSATKSSSLDRTMMMASFQDEARQLRLRTIKTRVSHKEVVKAMERLLELSYFVVKWMEDLPIEASGAPKEKTRSPYISLFDSVWQSTKIALGQWEEKVSTEDYAFDNIKFLVSISLISYCFNITKIVTFSF